MKHSKLDKLFDSYEGNLLNYFSGLTPQQSKQFNKLQTQIRRKVTMNTTIMYSFPNDLKYRYMSFNTYEKALKAIELFTQINVKAEVKV